MAKLWIIPTIRGLAYLASANYIARIILFLDNLANSFFSYEMVLLYSAHLDTHILLFFQAVFMLPVALLGILVFYGIEKQSFNLVLYPTLMLLFLILLRYGAEMALLIIHWDEHSLVRGPSLIFYGVLDLIAIIILLLYVYMSLAAPPLPNTITPSRLNSLRRKLQRFSSKGGGDGDALNLDIESGDTNGKSKNSTPKIVGVTKKKKKPPAAPPPPPEGLGEEEGLISMNSVENKEFEEEDRPRTPPPRPPPSPKFNYKLRRNVAHLEKDEDKIQAAELDKQKQRNSQEVIKEDKEGEESAEAERESPTPTFTLKLKSQSLKTYDTEPKRRSLLIETDLDLSAHEEAKPADSPSQDKKEVEEKDAIVQDEKIVVHVETKKSDKKESEPPEIVEEPQPTVAAEEGDIKPKKEEEDDGSEWEYEYEVEPDNVVKEEPVAEPAKQPQPEGQEEGNKIAKNETLEKTVEKEQPKEDNNVYQPETTTSSTGYKTTAV